MTLILL